MSYTTPSTTPHTIVLYYIPHRGLILKLGKVQERGKRQPPVHMLYQRIQRTSQEKMNLLLPNLEVI